MNPEPAAEWIAAGPASSLAPGEIRGLTLRGLRIALYNVDGALYATDDECTHGYALLSEGRLDCERIECPAHGGVFDVRTGEALEPPAYEDVRTYPVRLRNDVIEVGLPSGDSAA